MTTHDTDHHAHHAHGDMTSRGMAVSATLHCLTGCAIGEIVGLLIGTAAGYGNATTVLLSVALAFVFGYSLSTMPLLRAGLGLGAALAVVLAADTLSILSMEVVDNLVVVIVPGAMNAGLVNPVFWLSMLLALSAAFGAAYPVNRYLLSRGKGHALTHEYHGSASRPTGVRRFIPDLATPVLLTMIVAFIAGGLVVSIGDELSQAPEASHGSLGTTAQGGSR